MRAEQRARLLQSIKFGGSSLLTAALQYGNEETQNNRELVLAAVRQNGANLQFASYQLRGDRDVVLAAIRQNGLALQFASSQMRGDRDVVLAAIRQNGLALQFASFQMRGDRDVVLAAVEQNGAALQFANNQQRANPIVVFASGTNGKSHCDELVKQIMNHTVAWYDLGSVSKSIPYKKMDKDCPVALSNLSGSIFRALERAKKKPPYF